MQTHDPLRAGIEIREQLCSEKRRLAFFMGAGTSMAVGLPGIAKLTGEIPPRLGEPFKSQYEKIRSVLPQEADVEAVLNRLRIYRELIAESETADFGGITGATAARKLDSAVCNTICQVIAGDPPRGLKKHLTLAQWLRALHSNRDWPVEIFTTNYDLLMEQAMEEIGVPFFDGFIGSVAPFFVPESVEAEPGKAGEPIYPPRYWTRVFKLHGSINWSIQKSTTGERITRLSGSNPRTGDELMIFPSREKYAQSRKLPFLTFQDRLRRFLSNGESLLIVTGYSFSDEHLNEIIFQGLRSNPRLAIMALSYGVVDEASTPPGLILADRLVRYGEQHRNLTIYGPDKACIGGIVGAWGEPGRKQKETEQWPFWDQSAKRFTLGDFNCFVSFLETFIGSGSDTATTSEGSPSLGVPAGSSTEVS